MAESATFRTQLSGYNKDDVNNYIEEQNLSFSRKEATLKKTLNEKQEQINSLTAQVAELKKIPDLTAPLEAEKEKVKALAEENKGLAAIAEAHLTTVSELTEENTKLKEELETLRRRIEEAANKPAEIKEAVPAEDAGQSIMYDKVSRQLGSMLIDAREMTDNMVSSAKERSEKIIADARDEAKKIISDAGEKNARALDAAAQCSKRLISNMNMEYLKYISETKEDLNRFLDDNSQKQQKLADLLARLKDECNREAAAKIDAIKQQ